MLHKTPKSMMNIGSGSMKELETVGKNEKGGQTSGRTGPSHGHQIRTINQVLVTVGLSRGGGKNSKPQGI